MKYNLKLIEYPDDVQASYYDVHIIRGEKDDKVINENDKYSIGDNLQKSWYNPTTGKMEIIPKGYIVEINPFNGEECLCEIPEDDNRAELVRNMFRSWRRTKQNVYQIARGSVWDMFITLTIADHDIRFDLDACKKRVGKKFNKIRERYAPDLKYLIIFEKHPTSGAWHVHGLIKGIDGLTLNKAFNPHTGELIFANDMQIYNIRQFDSLGFSTATFVENNKRVTQYILKYITKDMTSEYSDKKSYLCSKGLPRGNEVLLEVEDETDIEDALRNYLGYIPQKTHARKGFNIYNGANILYEQYKKN